MSLANVRTPAAWNRARLSALVPVGLIVAVAVICIVVAVVTSARLADEVAVQHDEELFINALAGHRERVLREVQSIATSEETVARLRESDIGWIERQYKGDQADQWGETDCAVLTGWKRGIKSIGGEPTDSDQRRAVVEAGLTRAAVVFLLSETRNRDEEAVLAALILAEQSRDLEAVQPGEAEV